MVETRAFHEEFVRSAGAKAGSERAFGIVFAVVFGIVGLFPLFGGGEIRAWALVVGAVFLALAFFAPRALGPANRLWFRFGTLLHGVVTPLILAFVFFGVVTPTAWLMRCFSKDSLHLAFDRTAETYWIRRDPPGPAPDTMKHQF